MGRQVDKQRYERQKGAEALNQCPRGKAPPEEERGQKAEGGSQTTYLLCLLDKPLLKVTLSHPAGQSLGRTNVGQLEEGGQCGGSSPWTCGGGSWLIWEGEEKPLGAEELRC